MADGVKLQLPNTFWTRLQSTFGNTFFVRDKCGSSVYCVLVWLMWLVCVAGAWSRAWCLDSMQFPKPRRRVHVAVVHVAVCSGVAVGDVSLSALA